MNKELCDRVSTEAVLDICVEECSELIQAISKYKRATGNGLPTNRTKEEAIAMITEEAGQVTGCIDGLIYKLNLSKDELYKNLVEGDMKIAHRLDNIEKGEDVNA